MLLANVWAAALWLLLLLLSYSVPGAGDEMVVGDSVGIMPQAPGQQPMGPAQLAALLRWGPVRAYRTKCSWQRGGLHLIEAVTHGICSMALGKLCRHVQAAV